jgi:hypothetical protein
MKPRMESELSSSPRSNKQMLVASKTTTTTATKMPYFGGMLTICIFGVSNYLWLATSLSSNLFRQSSVISVPLDYDGNDGNMLRQAEQHVNASVRAYISQTVEKDAFAHQPLMKHTYTGGVWEDTTARASLFSSTSIFSSPSPSSSSHSCATVNQEVLNMGNRTRLGTGEKILLVGLAKAGTTSVGGFFQRAGYNSCDFRCGKKVSNNSGTVGRCMWQAQRDHKPLIASCGGDEIEMYAQMDTIGWPRKGFCFFPQIDALDDLHAEHPNATLILNMRQVR